MKFSICGFIRRNTVELGGFRKEVCYSDESQYPYEGFCNSLSHLCQGKGAFRYTLIATMYGQSHSRQSPLIFYWAVIVVLVLFNIDSLKVGIGVSTPSVPFMWSRLFALDEACALLQGWLYRSQEASLLSLMPVSLPPVLYYLWWSCHSLKSEVSHHVTSSSSTLFSTS